MDIIGITGEISISSICVNPYIIIMYLNMDNLL